MIIAVIVLLTALAISGVAAYYSIVGLMAIFSGAATTIAIMGSALEVGKLVTASWLYHFWDRAPVLLKTYLTLAVIVLMFITSMGIFGYLSRAHLAQIGPADEAKAQIEKINFDIEQQEKKIERASHVLKRFDQALEQYYKMEYVTRALREREKQKEERESLQGVIKEANAEIDRLVAARFEAQKKLRGIEAEVGPIKYIAELIYGERAKDFMDESVRAVIIVLIFVFDPLAVLLVVAGNMSIRIASEKRRERKARESMAPPEREKSEEARRRPGKKTEEEPADEAEQQAAGGQGGQQLEQKLEEEPEEEPSEQPLEVQEDEVDEKFDSLISEEKEEEEVLTKELMARSRTLSEEEAQAKRRTLKLVKPVDIDEEQSELLVQRVEEASATGDYTLERIFGEIVTEMDGKKSADSGDKGASKPKKKPGR